MKEERPIISIIIPVYNVEKYLDRCLQSVVEQSYRNLEIILVDDGSTDQSGGMCDRWKEKDGRIKVIHKQNEGLGMARNTGLLEATGAYYSFIDSDDYVRVDMFECLLGVVEEHDAPVCYGGCVDVSEKGEFVCNGAPSKLVYSGKAEIRQFLGNTLATSPEVTQRRFTGISAWGNLYAAELFKEKGIRFEREQQVLSEDIFFNIAVCQCVELVVIAPYNLYYYCANEGTLTKKYRPDRFEAAKNMNVLLRERLKHEISQESFLKQRIERNFMDNMIVCLKQEIAFRKVNGIEFCMKQLRRIAEDVMTEEILAHYPISGMEKKQRILFTMVKRKQISAVYWLFRLRYRMG